MIKVISGVLPRNATTLILSDSTITNNSIFEVYTDNCDVIPVCVNSEGTSVNITFENTSTSSTQVKVLINNINGELTYSADSIVYELLGTEITNQGEFNATVWLNIGNIESKIGNLTELTTINKTNIVESINECKSNIDSNSNKIGDLSGLETTENDNLVDAINDCFQYVSNGKILIADAITDKGIETSATDTFQTMANNIENIVQHESDIIKFDLWGTSGKKAYLILFNSISSSMLGSISVYKDSDRTNLYGEIPIDNIKYNENKIAIIELNNIPIGSSIYVRLYNTTKTNNIWWYTDTKTKVSSSKIGVNLPGISFFTSSNSTDVYLGGFTTGS